jgi:hypothetical protein
LKTISYLLVAGRNGDIRLTDSREMPGDDVAGLWTGYHNALGLKKSTPCSREQSVSPSQALFASGSLTLDHSAENGKMTRLCGYAKGMETFIECYIICMHEE